MPATDPCTLLAQARQARHDYLTGKGISEFRDQNGESVKYNAFKNIGDLDNYIAELDRQCNPTAPLVASRRPLGFFF